LIAVEHQQTGARGLPHQEENREGNPRTDATLEMHRKRREETVDEPIRTARVMPPQTDEPTIKRRTVSSPK